MVTEILKITSQFIANRLSFTALVLIFLLYTELVHVILSYVNLSLVYHCLKIVMLQFISKTLPDWNHNAFSVIVLLELYNILLVMILY